MARENSLMTPSRYVAYVAGLLFLIGSVGLYVTAAHNSQVVVRLVEIPLKFDADRTATGRFIAPLSETYDVELEIDWLDPPNEVRKLISVMDRQSEIDVRWAISNEKQQVAAGDCQDYTYIRFESSLKSRLRDRLLGVGPDVKILTPTLARGIGRFAAQADQSYHVTVIAGANSTPISAFEPRLTVRINRVYWHRHCSKYSSVGYASLIAIGVSLALTTWWAATILLSFAKRRHAD